MFEELAPQQQDELQPVSLDEKKVLLRTLLWSRAFCPRCPVVNRGFHLDPCYSCIVLPKESRRLMTTVN
jgi:hypothetical protein